MTAVGTSITRSACLGFSLRLNRFQVQTCDVSVLQSPSPILHSTHSSGVCWRGSRVAGDADAPAVGAGQHRPRAAPGHPGDLKVPLHTCGMLKTLVARDLQTEGSTCGSGPERLLLWKVSSMNRHHWIFSPDYWDRSSSPGTRRRRDSCYF